MKKKLLIFCNALMFLNLSMAQQPPVMDLYAGNIIPNAKPCTMQEKVVNERGHIGQVVRPTVTVYIPEHPDSNKAAVIICPGGGYGILAIHHEGYDVAKAFNQIGVTAFVLKYRLPNDECMDNRSMAPLQDAQQAIALVRQKADSFHINPNNIGIMGFSAGGHLAASAATHFERPALNFPVSVKPDFAILIYPVISFMDSLTHKGSRTHLLGDVNAADRNLYFSNELQVTPQTPPCFLVHAEDDGSVKVENAIEFFKALRNNKIPASLNVYPAGGHGFGMENKTTKDRWFDRLIWWMKDTGLVQAKR